MGVGGLARSSIRTVEGNRGVEVWAHRSDGAGRARLSDSHQGAAPQVVSRALALTADRPWETGVHLRRTWGRLGEIDGSTSKALARRRRLATCQACSCGPPCLPGSLVDTQPRHAKDTQLLRGRRWAMMFTNGRCSRLAGREPERRWLRALASQLGWGLMSRSRSQSSR